MSVAKSLPFRILIVVALLAIVVVSLWRGWGGPEDGLTLYGNVELREVELAFVLPERIAAVHAEEGDRVRRGDLLAELDGARFEQALALRQAQLEAARQKLAQLEHGARPQEIRRAEAELAAAEASAREASASFDRIKQLLAQQLASPQQRDDAEAALDSARARVSVARESLALVKAGPREETIALARAELAAAEANLALAQKDLDDTRLLAPVDGVIRARILEPGDIAAPQKPVFTLARRDPVWVRAYLSETELGRVKPGMAAGVESDSFPDKRYPGRVGYISPTAEFTPKTVQTSDVRSSLVYQVRIIVDDPDEELRLGMPVTVHFALDHNE